LNAPAALPRDPEPSDWPVLVTGAGGFVGGHVARHLAGAGHRVRGLVRRRPRPRPGDTPIEWITGDLRDPEACRRAVEGVRGVVHSAGWVSLGRDPRGLSHEVNVAATVALLEAAMRAGVERFVFTSTLHTLAAGTPEHPADEHAAWNLHSVDSPYARTKREAEAHVRAASSRTFSTVVLCPGMVIGPRDPKPTSTRLLLALARSPIAVLPRGGIPMIDAGVLALAHRRALICGEPGARYAVVGPYLSYAELARAVADVAGWPCSTILLPDVLLGPLRGIAVLWDRLGLGAELSGTSVAGGFLRLHVSGHRADHCFGLTHPPPLESIRAALVDARDAGRIPGLRA
jgi:dihydroflavonol-4-reductase